MPTSDLFLSSFGPISALIKQVNKSIDGTADDEEEGVPTDEAIRAGLELLKVVLAPSCFPLLAEGNSCDNQDNLVLLMTVQATDWEHWALSSFVPRRCCLLHTQSRSTLQRPSSPYWAV